MEKLEFRFASGRQDTTGNVYPLEELQKCVGKEYYGMLYNPDINDPPYAVDPERISHKVENLRIEYMWLVGDVKVLDTVDGIILDQIIKDDKTSVTFYPSGVGTVNKDRFVSDYELTAIHAQYIIDTAELSYDTINIGNPDGQSTQKDQDIS